MSENEKITTTNKQGEGISRNPDFFGRPTPGTTLSDAFLHKQLVAQGWAVLSWRLSGYLIILLENTSFGVAVILI